jgi:hypothetical protein
MAIQSVLNDKDAPGITPLIGSSPDCMKDSPSAGKTRAITEVSLDPIR